jgi:hypothetical protein
MKFLKAKIEKELQIPTFDPPNGTVVTIPLQTKQKVFLSCLKLQEKYEILKESLLSDTLNKSKIQNKDHMDTDIQLENMKPITQLSLSRPDFIIETTEKIFETITKESLDTQAMNKKTEKWIKPFNPFPFSQESSELAIKQKALTLLCKELDTWLDVKCILNRKDCHILVSKGLVVYCTKNDFSFALEWEEDQKELAIQALAVLNATF